MEEPILVTEKKADFTTNKMIIPKSVIKKFGYYYYMKVYDDKIVLIPIEKKD